MFGFLKEMTPGDWILIAMVVINLVHNLMSSYVVTRNHLKHVDDNQKIIIEKLEGIESTQVKQGERIAKIEGRLNGSQT